MANEPQGTAGGNATANAGNGGNAAGSQTGTGTNQQSSTADKTVFTKEEFERELQREADRRVTEAQKAWAAKQAEILAAKDRDAEAKVRELEQAAKEHEEYAAFIEAAHVAGIRNVKAAHLVAKGGGYFDQRGKFNVEKFRNDNPEFFLPMSGNANAGSGAGGNQSSTFSMDRWIRSQAGR